MVTMDQIVVDCGDDDSVRPGDEVVLLGRQGERGRSRPTTGRPCWARSATRWCAASGPRHAPRPGQPPRRGPVPDADVAGAAAPHRARPARCCPLAEGRTQVVFGVGDPAADLLFVGEGPGREEDLAGEPFVGRSGKLLDRLMWEEIGLTRAECYIANVVKCRPPNNRDPAPNEIEACRPYLDEQITLIEPDGDRDARQLRHQAAAREHAGHPRSCAARSSSAAGPAWSRRTTRPTCCGPAARPWPRCGPTSCGPSASWRSGRRRERGPLAVRDRRRRRRPGRVAGGLARAVPRRRRRAARRRPRRRQDGVRPGLRRRARGGGPGDQPDVRAGAPLPLRRRQPGRAADPRRRVPHRLAGRGGRPRPGRAGRGGRGGPRRVGRPGRPGAGRERARGDARRPRRRRGAATAACHHDRRARALGGPGGRGGGGSLEPAPSSRRAS